MDDVWGAYGPSLGFKQHPLEDAGLIYSIILRYHLIDKERTGMNSIN